MAKARSPKAFATTQNPTEKERLEAINDNNPAVRFKYRLGMLVRDKITGFEGIIRYRLEYLTGCNQYGVQPEAKDNKIPDAYLIDENSISIIGEGVAGKFAKTPEDPGGPMGYVPGWRNI